MDNTFTLAYHAPYNFPRILNILKRQWTPGVELITDSSYSCTVSHRSSIGTIHVEENDTHTGLTVTCSPSLIIDDLLKTRIVHLFDLDTDPKRIVPILCSFNSQTDNLYNPDQRIPGYLDPYTLCIRAILGQQISVKAASTITSRFVQAYGKPIKTGIEGLTHLFPDAETIASINNFEDTLGALGIISGKSKAIYTLSNAFVSDSFRFETEVLENIKGIGPWSAAYLCMRNHETDLFPSGVPIIRQSFEGLKPKEIAAVSEQWSPWRSYAVFALCFKNKEIIQHEKK